MKTLIKRKNLIERGTGTPYVLEIFKEFGRYELRVESPYDDAERQVFETLRDAEDAAVDLVIDLNLGFVMPI